MVRRKASRYFWLKSLNSRLLCASWAFICTRGMPDSCSCRNAWMAA